MTFVCGCVCVCGVCVCEDVRVGSLDQFMIDVD